MQQKSCKKNKKCDDINEEPDRTADRSVSSGVASEPAWEK
jgi:hypothetical protein